MNPKQISDIFCCPLCKGPLADGETSVRCDTCDQSFELNQGMPDFFLPGSELPSDANASYHALEMAEVKDTYYRLHARALKGMAFCMEQIGQRTSAGSRVLEVGMGTGRFTGWLAESVHPQATIFAFDFSRPMMEKARTNTANFANVVLFRGNARGPMPFRPESFDIVLVRLAPFKVEGHSHAAGSALHLLRPGGWLFEAMTTAGERPDTPPTQWAMDKGFESAESHIWRYPHVATEEEYLSALLDAPRPSYLTPDIEKARALTAAMKKHSGHEDGIPGVQVESLLVARKAGSTHP